MTIFTSQVPLPNNYHFFSMLYFNNKLIIFPENCNNRNQHSSKFKISSNNSIHSSYDIEEVFKI